jgi:hypothetical protein
MTALDEAETHRRKSRKHYYRAAAIGLQIHQLLKDQAGEWEKAALERDLETAARETAAEAMFRASLTGVEEDTP